MKQWAKITIEFEEGSKFTAERAFIDPADFSLEGPWAVSSHSETKLPLTLPLNGPHEFEVRALLHPNDEDEVYRWEQA